MQWFTNPPFQLSFKSKKVLFLQIGCYENIRGETFQLPPQNNQDLLLEEVQGSEEI